MIAEPTVLPPKNLGAPSDALELEWVHGYRAQDIRQNLWYTCVPGQVVYPAAQLVVRLDVGQWQQKFMTSHSDQV